MTTLPAPTVVRPHYVMVGRTWMVCVQPECDGHHHYYREVTAP